MGSKVLPEFDGLRLDRYLGLKFPFLSRNSWKDRIESGEVLVNLKKVRVSSKIKSGDGIFMYHPDTREPEVETRIEVIFEDRGVLCAVKPAGLPMHEGGAFRTKTFARSLTAACGPGWSAIHRLDKETSGIVLCGANEQIRRALTQDLRASRIRKEYLAIVQGVPDRKVWYVDAPLGNLEESQIRIKKWVVPDGLPSMTEFILEDVAEDGFALIRAFPRTGRTNQIRIHSAYCGHPLIGDKLYHPDERVFLEYWANGTTEEVIRQAGHWRCCLHAAALSFTHPVTGDSHRVSAPLAEDMDRLWAQLRGNQSTKSKNIGASIPSKENQPSLGVTLEDLDSQV